MTKEERQILFTDETINFYKGTHRYTNINFESTNDPKLDGMEDILKSIENYDKQEEIDEYFLKNSFVPVVVGNMSIHDQSNYYYNLKFEIQAIKAKITDWFAGEPWYNGAIASLDAKYEGLHNEYLKSVNIIKEAIDIVS